MSLTGGGPGDVSDHRPTERTDTVTREVEGRRALLVLVEEVARSIGEAARAVAGTDRDNRPARPVTVRVRIDVEAGERDD